MPRHPPGDAQAVDLGRARAFDLAYDIAADGPAWPGSRAPFRLDTLVASPTAAMFRLTLNEHFGTHLDAPRHGSGSGWTNEQIPLSRLMGPAYFGADSIVAPTRLHFPSLGPAAEVLVQRGIALFGVDSPSTDIGAAPFLAVHGLLARANIPSVENLADLGGVPRTGAVVVALLIKTRGGSGGPVRVVALVP